MKKLSKVALIIIGLSLITSVLYLILPSIYVEQNNKVIMGWTVAFGGNIRYLADMSKYHIGVSAGNLICFLLPFVTAFIAYVGQSQRSTWFFTFCTSVATGVLCLLEKKFFLGINVAGSIGGMQSARMFLAPYFCMTLSFFASFVSLFGLFYKPDERLSRK